VRRESELARVLAERERSRWVIGSLLGVAGPVVVVLPQDPGPDERPEVEALLAEALSRRAELKADEAAIRAGESQVRSAWWRHAPQLSASVTGFASDVPFPSGDRSGWKATAELSWTQYDGGFRYGKLRQAEAGLEASRASFRARQVEIEREVRDALRDVAVARERLRLAEQQKALADQAASTAHRSVKAGLTGSLELLDADERAYQADVGLADARARLGIARAALERATGKSTGAQRADGR